MDGTLDRERYLAALESDVAAMSHHLAGDLSVPVAACAGWDLGDLGAHLGVVHRWATAALTSSVPPAEEPAPARAELASWFADGAAALLRGLWDADPDTACWGFGPHPRTVGFWVRRQALETTVHAWDAADALGRAAVVPADLAADGVDEVVSVMYPRQVRLGRRAPVPATVSLRCADVDAPACTLGEGEPDAVVAAPAEQLLLLLWGRRTLEELVASGAARLGGDPAAARAALGGPLTP